jgi:hypothetical protein
MKILVSYRAIPQSPGWATGDMVVRALKRAGHEVSVYAKLYQEDKWLEDRSVRFDSYDLFLFLECNDDDLRYMDLKGVDAKQTACWLFDTSYYPDQCEAMVRYFGFDHVFLANPLSIEHFKSRGFSPYYLPYAYDPELHVRGLNHPKTIDVALVGSIREDRKDLQKELTKRGVNLELIGDVFREDYINTLASAKVVINQNPEAGRGLLNMRFFEAQAAGSYVLTEEADLSLNKFCFSWTAGQYSDVDDLAEKCSRLLTRKGIVGESLNEELFALHGDNFLEKHSYDARCRSLLNEIN